MTRFSPDAPGAATARLTVHPGAIRDNYRALARRASVPLLPMVKADAYGLGAAAAVRALAPERPLAWGVATVAEGAALREAGVTGRIVCFTPLPRGAFAGARAAGLELVLETPADVAQWGAAGGAWHLQLDTGMGRAGVRWDDAAALAACLAAGPAPASVFTHFHSADAADGTMAEQLARFERVLAALPARPACVHVANTAAIVRGAAGTFDCARPGIGLFGVNPWGAGDWTPAPAVTLAAPIVALRTVHAGDAVSYGATWRAAGTRRIATAAIGYADGLPRSAGNHLVARVHGAAAPVVGVVTMDMTMLDVTEAPCAVGDEAVFVGEGAATIAGLAAAAQRSPYEVLTGLHARAERVQGAPAAETPAADTPAADAPRVAGVAA